MFRDAISSELDEFDEFDEFVRRRIPERLSLTKEPWSFSSILKYVNVVTHILRNISIFDE